MSRKLGITVEDDVRERLKLLADRRDRPTHWLIKKAIEEYLAREETYEREHREDLERWERYQLTGEAVSNDQVLAWLDQLAAGNRHPWPK
jgi:predicted transcriptional regulator